MKRYLYLVNPWWEGRRFDAGIARPFYTQKLKEHFNSRLIQILTGLRRVGKTTIAFQLIQSLLKSGQVSPKHLLFFSAEEPSLIDKSFVEVIDFFRTEHSLSPEEKIFVFIDEVQFAKNWEQQIKSLYDSEKIKFVLTGSSAMLLSEKLAFLTGRYLKLKVFPLSFSEYLSFKNLRFKQTEAYLVNKQIKDYLVSGGMPEYVLNPVERYLETTVESILFKDLVSKFKLRNPSLLTELLYLLADRIGTRTSSLKLARLLEINKDTILTYLDYLEKTFITAKLPNYAFSRNKQVYNPPKIYFEDTGIASHYASKINWGALAENAVFNHLRVQLKDKLRVKLGYWYEKKLEVDFVLEISGERYLIESKWVDKKEKIDFKPLKQAISQLKPKKIFYVTYNVDDRLTLDGLEVRLLPLARFLQQDLVD